MVIQSKIKWNQNVIDIRTEMKFKIKNSPNLPWRFYDWSNPHRSLCGWKRCKWSLLHTKDVPSSQPHEVQNAHFLYKQMDLHCLPGSRWSHFQLSHIQRIPCCVYPLAQYLCWPLRMSDAPLLAWQLVEGFLLVFHRRWFSPNL